MNTTFPVQNLPSSDRLSELPHRALGTPPLRGGLLGVHTKRPATEWRGTQRQVLDRVNTTLVFGFSRRFAASGLRPALAHALALVAISGLLAAPTLAASNDALALTEPIKAESLKSESWRSGRSPGVLKLLDDYVEWQNRNDPIGASTRGEHRFDDQLPDVSPEGIERQSAETVEFLNRARAIPTQELSEADRVDLNLLTYELDLAVKSARFHREQMPVDKLSGPQVWLPQMANSLPLRTSEDRAAYARRLERVPEFVDQTIANMRQGLRAGRVPPKVVMMGVDGQARTLATKDIEETPALSPFYAPFRSRPADDESAIRARKAILEGIVPAYRRFADFVEREYLPKCRDTVGISQGIDGLDAYAQALRVHTTTDMTPDEVHRLGLSEVARIKAEMMKVIARSDFEAHGRSGDELFRAFVEYLRTDKRFYFETPEALLAAYRDIAKRIDPELTKVFGVLPRLTYGIREIPAFAAPTSPTAYYSPGSLAGGVPGYFLANTYALDQRPKYEMISLTLHEAVPGHHLQIALALEQQGVHPFRTLTGYTAFVEGWGLYAERLGLEMGEGKTSSPADPLAGATGLFTDPYDDFGRLTYEMWRACRLVVDTGLHAMGWSKDQAVMFMQSNTALSKLNIDREVDRYIGWPGQACAYKIGELKLRELRGRAEKALGERFDKRAFHDTVLGAGAIPLPTLEARVDRWIAEQR